MPFGTEYTPLIARVARNKKRPEQVVGFIKFGDREQLCFFERNSEQPKAGTEVEVMITGPVHPYEDGGYPDTETLKGLRVRAVDQAQHVLVAIDGFEMAGSMCRNLAMGALTLGLGEMNVTLAKQMSEPTKGLIPVSPGRTGARFADNVNPRFYGREYAAPVPTNVWIERNPANGLPVKQPGGTCRAIGLTRIEDLECAHLVERQLKRAA
ncbi:hypothetical protein [Croceicoccus sp. Ery15]|uniref:hypothetical protein n=1 Tax=Croceicoccus sp. Ery15 TaxID=1703338 RepID=UPI001E4F53F3|nr:hypothetical protein [Croceicoccus sp. Ery15]